MRKIGRQSTNYTKTDTIRHQNPDELSGDMLEYEIIKGQDCLHSRGINSTVFAYPYGNGWDNSTVVKLIADNYDVGWTSSKYPLAFMNCDYWNMAELVQPLEKIRNQKTMNLSIVFGTTRGEFVNRPLMAGNMFILKGIMIIINHHAQVSVNIIIILRC